MAVVPWLAQMNMAIKKIKSFQMMNSIESLVTLVDLIQDLEQDV